VQKTVELIEMPFGLWAWMGCRNRVRWGSSGAEGRYHGNQFWDVTCITGFVGYDFGCIIAGNALFDSRGGFSGSNYPMKT